jgi:hypothetical protein
MRHSAILAIVATTALAASAGLAQNPGVFRDSRGHPAIQYSTRPTDDAVARLNQRIAKGEVSLAFEPPQGFLKSVLAALQISPASQTLVFSANSLQREHISKATPRAIYFNDSVEIGWAPTASRLRRSTRRRESCFIHLRNSRSRSRSSCADRSAWSATSRRRRAACRGCSR